MFYLVFFIQWQYWTKIDFLTTRLFMFYQFYKDKRNQTNYSINSRNKLDFSKRNQWQDAQNKTKDWATPTPQNKTKDWATPTPQNKTKDWATRTPQNKTKDWAKEELNF
jgi:hypothetical protein